MSRLALANVRLATSAITRDRVRLPVRLCTAPRTKKTQLIHLSFSEIGALQELTVKRALSQRLVAKQDHISPIKGR